MLKGAEEELAEHQSSQSLKIRQLALSPRVYHKNTEEMFFITLNKVKDKHRVRLV